MYDWMLGFSRHPRATWALFAFSFAEASFFPLPPDILQIPMTLERPDRAWYFAGVSTVASVLGGVLGYGIGFMFKGIAHWLFSEAGIERIRHYFDDVWLLTAGTILVHPYKLFTIAAGVFHVSMVAFLIASTIGRAARFYLLAGLLWKFGAPVKHVIEKYFNLCTVVLGIIIVGAFLVARL